MRISDANVGGTYLTMLACAGNFGEEISASVGLYALDLLNYSIAVFIFWLFGSLIVVCMIKSIN